MSHDETNDGNQLSTKGQQTATMLESMGFKSHQCAMAAQIFGDDVTSAANYLSEYNEQQKFVASRWKKGRQKKRGGDGRGKRKERNRVEPDDMEIFFINAP